MGLVINFHTSRIVELNTLSYKIAYVVIFGVSSFLGVFIPYSAVVYEFVTDVVSRLLSKTVFKGLNK
jgi:hypothetical protein